jgi:hypothetical protein
MSAVMIQELELETAELLPARETLVVGVDPKGPICYPGPVYPDSGRITSILRVPSPPGVNDA